MNELPQVEFSWTSRYYHLAPLKHDDMSVSLPMSRSSSRRGGREGANEWSKSQASVTRLMRKLWLEDLNGLQMPRFRRGVMLAFSIAISSYLWSARSVDSA